MLKNNLIVIVGADGSLLSEPIGRLQANANFSAGITVITPLDYTNVVSITFSKRNRIDDDVTQYLLPIGNVKGKDVLPQDHPLYQTVYNWNVFENDVDSIALAYVAKYRGGILFASVSAGSHITPLGATNYKGTFGTGKPLPITADDGDYYVSNTYNYFDNDILFTLDDYAYWKDGKWHKSNYRGVLGTDVFEVAVSPNVKSNVEITSDLDLAILLAGRVAIAESEIVSLGGRADVLESDVGELQVEVIRLEVDKADLLYVNQQLATKARKPDNIGNANFNTLYLLKENGEESQIIVGHIVSPNAVVKRGNAGHIYVPVAMSNEHAINKLQLETYAYDKDYVTNEFLNYVKKTLTIAGLDLTQNRSADDIANQLREATAVAKGLLSAEHYELLVTLNELLENGDDNSFVDTIREVLEVLQNYPQGADLAQQLGDIEQNITNLQTGKVNKDTKINNKEIGDGLRLYGDDITIDNANYEAIDNKNIEEILVEFLTEFNARYKKTETYNTYEIDTKIQDMLYHGVFLIDLGGFADVEVTQLIDLGGF